MALRALSRLAVGLSGSFSITSPPSHSSNWPTCCFMSGLIESCCSCLSTCSVSILGLSDSPLDLKLLLSIPDRYCSWNCSSVKSKTHSRSRRVLPLYLLALHLLTAQLLLVGAVGPSLHRNSSWLFPYPAHSRQAVHTHTSTITPTLRAPLPPPPNYRVLPWLYLGCSPLFLHTAIMTGQGLSCTCWGYSSSGRVFPCLFITDSSVCFRHRAPTYQLVAFVAWRMASPREVGVLL